MNDSEEDPLQIEVQTAIDYPKTPEPDQIIGWARLVLNHHHASGELCVRIVDEAESAKLNRHYRQKSGPTNVLSFHYDDDDILDASGPLMGDLVICAPIVAREAAEQNKSEIAHWAHMVIHGTLHILGYDHLSDEDADEMETLEIQLLNELGFSNPYGDNKHP